MACAINKQKCEARVDLEPKKPRKQMEKVQKSALIVLDLEEEESEE